MRPRLRARAALATAFLLVIASPALAAFPRTLLAPTGEHASDRFGTSVASAGDMNGDGFSDVIVGAQLADQRGRAYVFLGGAAPDSTPDLVLEGESAGDQFGWSVASAGDLNGDGFDDLLVGGYLNATRGAEAGRVYLYFGGATPDPIADLVLTAAAAGDHFGRSVGSAGDFNDDGYPDFAVGAYLNDAAGADAGRVYLYYGGPVLDTIPDLILNGAMAGDEFGFSVARAGDVNGDHVADLIVASIFNDAGGANAGRAYVFFGGPSPDSIPDLILTGEAPGDLFSFMVASAGDVNDDGFSDLIVGAPLNDAVASNAGRAYLFLGGPVPDAIPDRRFNGAAAGDDFGLSVASAGDVNRDGFADVIVSAAGNDAAGTDAGRAYVYFGSSTPDTTPDFLFSGALGASLGFNVASAGDVNRDGYDDVVMGAHFDATAGIDAGRAYVVAVCDSATTGTLLSLFALERVPQGIEVRWRLAGAAEASLERSARSNGPWAAVTGERRESAGTIRILDRAAVPGERAFYRLALRLESGRILVLGTIEAPAIPDLAGAALAVSPCPVTGPARIEFTTARTGHVRLRVLDAQGRVVAILVDAVRELGRHRETWRDGRAAPGVYFVECLAAGSSTFGRMVLVR